MKNKCYTFPVSGAYLVIFAVGFVIVVCNQVRETLTFAALLRLPGDMPIASKLERVEAVIATLGLERSDVATLCLHAWCVWC